MREDGPKLECITLEDCWSFAFRNNSSEESEMASFSSVSLPQSLKGQFGFTPSCFSTSLGALGMGLASNLQLCPGKGPQSSQGAAVNHCAPVPPRTAHIRTRHPRS